MLGWVWLVIGYVVLSIIKFFGRIRNLVSRGTQEKINNEHQIKGKNE